MTVLSMLFAEHLRLDVRFVDDKSGLWQVKEDTPTKKHKSYNDHVNFLQRICRLDWESSKLTDNMMFLDLFV